MNTETNYEKLAVSPSEAAEMLGVGLPKVYDMTHMAGFPAIRVGHRILIPIEQLKDWLGSQVQNPCN